jgi:integrase
VRVRRALVEARGRGLVAGPPKSLAGRRVVSIPPAVVDVMREHLAEFLPDDPTALVFTGPKGGATRRGNFRKMTVWTKTVSELGLAGVHVHDLRHTGNTLAAMSGVSTRDLMARMGHDSMRPFGRGPGRASGRRVMALTSGGTGWRRWDSNPRPPACKAGALAS